jgi:hypothetical protein
LGIRVDVLRCGFLSRIHRVIGDTAMLRRFVQIGATGSAKHCEDVHSDFRFWGSPESHHDGFVG